MWEATIGSRTRGTGCPACDGKQVSTTNSLALLHPHLVEEWNTEKNGPHSIYDFTEMSGKKVWWKCKEADDHEWQAFIYTRSEGYGCPFCANRKGSGMTTAVSSTNRLSELFPEIAKEWHPTKNGDLVPDDFVYGSHSKVWWQCSKHPEHVWETKIFKRTMTGTGCPSCAHYGINRNEPTFYYVMRLADEHGFRWWKGGVSVDPERRANQIQRSANLAGLSLSVILHDFVEFKTGDSAVEFEEQMLGIGGIRLTSDVEFSGSTELFSESPLDFAREHFLLDNERLTNRQTT